MKYIYTNERREMGIITQRNYAIASNGFKYMQISGFFLERELNDKVINPLFVASNTPAETAVTNMVSQYKKDIPLLSVSASLGRGSNISFQESNAQLSDKCYEILQPEEMSYKVEFDFINMTKVFSVYQGADRTQSQSTNNYVCFSSSFGNIKQPSVVTDEGSYKNYAIIGGAGEGADRIMEILDLSGGGYQKEIFIDASSVEYDPEHTTLAEYKNNLRQYALSKMIEQYGIINNVEFDVMEGSYRYLQDFDIGDKCDIVIKEMNLIIEARIVSIYEVIKSGTHTITLEFGNQILKSRR